MNDAVRTALICGGGDLPIEVANALKTQDVDFRVFRIKGFADAALEGFEGHTVGLGEVGRLFGLMQAESCQQVCMMGYVTRPDFDHFDRDDDGKAHFATLKEAGKDGDDRLLSKIIVMMEAQGLKVVGAHQLAPDMTLKSGHQAGPDADEASFADMKKAIQTAESIGEMDIGQAAIVANGLILAVEAQEGTQAMIGRIATLLPTVRGQKDRPLGVLAKVCKPQQDRRLDMPTIGVDTVLACHAAHLKAIVGRADELLVVNRAETYATADRLGVSLYGL